MRQFVMLATSKVDASRTMMASAKIDGMRAIWLPETRGRVMGWDGGVSTGLWSRTGKPILAPDWWLDTLPKDVRLDGEIYFQSYNETMSICRAHNSGERWTQVVYHVFDIPNAFYTMGMCSKPDYFFGGSDTTQESFVDATATLGKTCLGAYAKALRQVVVNNDSMGEFYNTCLAEGYEGIMLRAMYSKWTPQRSKDLVKVKPENDSEAVVTGVTAGKGKYEGRLGALVVDWKGKTFELSGMTDYERGLDNWIGKCVTFRYNDLTPLGIPRFARYLRVRQDA